MGIRDEKNQRNRRELLEVGMASLRQAASIDDVTVRSLCAAAGVSSSTFYRLFRDRDSYLGELHVMLLGEAAIEGSALLEQVNTRVDSLAQWISLAVSAAQDFAAESLWFVPRFAPLRRRDPFHSRLQSEARAALVARAFDVLAERIGTDDPEGRRRAEVAVWVVGVTIVRGAAARAPLHGSEPEDRRLVGSVISRMLAGYLEPQRPTAVPLLEIPILPGARTGDSSMRTLILDAAERLLGSRDMADLSTLEIAFEAEVAPTTVHNVFGSKTSLFECLLQRGLDDMSAVAQAVLEETAVGSYERPDDVVAFASSMYSILAAAISQRLHFLAAFEIPERVSVEASEFLLSFQDQLVKRAISLAPPWVVEVGDLDAAFIAAVICKEVLQVAFWGPTPFGIQQDWTQPALIRELALLTASAALYETPTR